MLAATLANLRGVAERLLVVTRADNGPLHDWLAAHAGDCERLLVETRGLGHSLAQAVAHAPAARGWLVALGDMPQPATLRAIVAAIDHDNLVVPVHQGRPGHPRGLVALIANGCCSSMAIAVPRRCSPGMPCSSWRWTTPACCRTSTTRTITGGADPISLHGDAPALLRELNDFGATPVVPKTHGQRTPMPKP